MIDNDMEIFTAEEARSAGLLEAVKRGETVVAGSYVLTTNGLKFNQRAFVFKDRFGTLRVGRFKDERELLEVGNVDSTNEQDRIDFI